MLTINLVEHLSSLLTFESRCIVFGIFNCMLGLKEVGYVITTLYKLENTTLASQQVSYSDEEFAFFTSLAHRLESFDDLPKTRCKNFLVDAWGNGAEGIQAQLVELHLGVHLLKDLLVHV